MDNDIITLVNKYPNDNDLGREVRKYVADHSLVIRCKCGKPATIGDRCSECFDKDWIKDLGC